MATLRLTLAAITTAEVSGDTARELDDAEGRTVLTREVRKRREAAQTYGDAGRPELAADELAEAAIIEDYLPRQLDDDQVSAIVDEASQQVTEQTGDAPGRAHDRAGDAARDGSGSRTGRRRPAVRRGTGRSWADRPANGGKPGQPDTSVVRSDAARLL